MDKNIQCYLSSKQCFPHCRVRWTIDPIFARLDDLFVVDTQYPLLLVSLCDVLYFDSHFLAFVITVTTNRQLLCHSQLKDYNIYHTTNVGGPCTSH